MFQAACVRMQGLIERGFLHLLLSRGGDSCVWPLRGALRPLLRDVPGRFGCPDRILGSL